MLYVVQANVPHRIGVKIMNSIARDYIVPAIAGILLMVGGVFIALQPVMDPGYVHPIALCGTGIMFAMFGVAFAVWAAMAALMDKRAAEYAAR